MQRRHSKDTPAPLLSFICFTCWGQSLAEEERPTRTAISEWRPTTWYRVAAKRWAANADAQIEGSSNLPGLSFFRTAWGSSGYQ